MRIKQISVSGLFGIFDHVIPLNMDDRITVIHGPNGFGKTAMLRILNGFFNSRYSELETIPFSKFCVEFDDGSNFEIIKNYDDSENIENNLSFNFYQPSIAAKKWLHTPINFKENSSVNTELLHHYDLILFNPPFKSKEEPEWLKKLKNNIPIRLIESQRLLNLFPNRRSKLGDNRRNSILSPGSLYTDEITREIMRIEDKFDDKTPSILSTVSAYSNELAKLMQDKFKEYGTISQSLDRTFPMRVVKQQSASNITEKELQNQLNELEETRSRLIEVGLLDQDENSEFQIQPQDIDESTKNALSVYVEDVEKKLNVFTEIATKINLLKKIINNKFSYKEINFNKEKGFIFTTLYNSSLSDSKILSPTDLSSGEQHELVLLYELLFKVEPNSLVLIDEPELSLHVGWQVQFLKDLQEITKLADLDILIATHSPDIIQDRWDLTVELKGAGKMREFLTVDRVANQIRLRRSTYSGTFLLVEGSSDKIFYERFVDKLGCELVITAGKPSSKQRAIAILEILEKSNFQGVLAIVDADFDRLQNTPVTSPNLLRTDTHDLETMLIKSSALEKVISEFGSEEKITQLNRDIREVLIAVGVAVGYLRYISQSDELNLTFEGITFSKFIDEKNWQFNQLKLIQEIKNKSQAFYLKDEDLEKRLIIERSNNQDPWQVCCGHDLVEILSLGLRKAIGTNKTADVEANSLERNLRLAYEVAYFYKTQLYLEIRKWEINNQPFHVLQILE